MATNSNESVPSVCTRGKKCTNLKNHTGKCNNKVSARRFWEVSQFFRLKREQGAIRDRENSVKSAEEEANTKCEQAEKTVLVAEEKNKEAGLM